MAHKTDHWKDEQQGEGIPLLADLSIENCVEEMFRPYLPSVSGQTAQQQRRERSFAPALTAPPPSSGRSFEVVIRSFTNHWQPRSTDKPVPQVQAVIHSHEQANGQANGQESLPPTEYFAPVMMPRTAASIAPLLPHEIREELLELRTEVLYAVRTRQLQTLMICGVEPGAGTSFVAEHLSRILAEYAQMKVAFLTLVASHDRKTNRLARRAVTLPLQFLLRRTELPNLAEIASSNGPITLKEMLCYCSTAEALRQLKAEFDLILIDTPAPAMYGEAAALAALMDGVILVAEPHVTPLRRMDRAHRRLHKARAKVLGMVFNRQRRP
ncbi:MAG: hypothetical protein JNM09_08000 [Blastocatellia bacterium]|nr:hypothetical protein [Blastocatellia bacterium]